MTDRGLYPGADSLAGEAYVVIRERILRGELAVGQTVSRRKLAVELGMSLLPVSEAIRRLEFEGLVESRPRAGTRVRIPTEEDIRGHYIVRQALEAEAARLFATVATPRQRQELQRLAVRVDALSTQVDGDRFVYLGLHEKLHRQIAECTACQKLIDAIEKNHVLALTWLCVARERRSGPSHVHQKLMEVLSSGDSLAATEAMRAHVASALQNTLNRLEPYFQARSENKTSFSRSDPARDVVAVVE